MVFVTGDTHGNWMDRLKAYSFPEQREMTKEDYVIICGDFGIWDNSKREKYNLRWLDDKPFTTLFVSGNHENYDILDSLEMSEWHGGLVNFVRKSVIHLMRGQVFNIEDKTFFTFGGASSHDISAGILEPDDPNFKEKKKQLDKDPFALYRINHVSWWERELPSENEMEMGLDNLKKENNKVDYIITHSPSTSELYLMGGKGLYQSDVLTNYLEDVKANTEYNRHFFGHMHINKAINDKDICLYEQIIRIL